MTWSPKPLRDHADLMLGSSTKMPPWVRFTASGAQWVTTKGLPPHAAHFVQITGLTSGRVRGIPDNYVQAVVRKDYGEFMSQAEDHRAENEAKHLENELILCAWSEVEADFGPVFLEGHPDLGEVCL